MLEAIKYGLRNLANFQGRDARQTFWYFVLFVVVLRFVASLLISIPMTVGMMGRMFKAAGDGSDPRAVQAEVMGSMTDMLPQMLWLAIIVGGATALLLTASFVRRLHDSGLSGWWATIPLGFHIFALAQLPAQMQQATAMMTQLGQETVPDVRAMMQGQAGIALIAWIPLIIAVVLGIRKPTPGTNRYGTEPVSF